MKLMELGEICESMHQGINTAADKVDYSIDGYQILQSRNITQGFIDYTDSKRVDFETYQKYKEKYNPRPGDILLCNIGTIGNSLVVKQENDFLIAWNLFLLKVNQSLVHPNYLNYFLIYLRETNFYTKFLTGGTVKFISKTTLSSIKIPLPPLEEQKRIAAILDKADRIRRKRQEAIRLTEELGRSIFLDMFGDPVTNPKGWGMKILCDVSEILTGYAFKSDQYTQDNKDIRLCRGINILPECMSWNDTAYWNKHDVQEFERFVLREEDIVIAMDRPWISSGFKIAMIQRSDLPSLLVQRVARIRSQSSEWQKYLYFVIQHPAFELHSKPTETTVPHISPRDLQSFPIPIPDESTLQRFNQKIRIMDVINKKLLDSYKESENLFNSLLQRAFRGEL